MTKSHSKWKRNLVSIIIILIMVLSVLGIMLGRETGQTKKYKGHKFTVKNNKWYLQGIDFDYFPTDVEEININQEVKDKILNTKMFYITFNPENVTKSMDKLRFDLTNLLAQFDIYVASSMTKNSTKYQLPVVTCKNATSFVPVMELKLENQTNINIEDNCIIAKAKSAEDIIKLRDAIIYNLIGVI